MVSDDRGQAHTLEAVAASLLLLTSIGFALQMTAVTPLSASTSSQHLENQLQSTGEGLLASNAETGALKEAVLYWNKTTRQFHGAENNRYYTRSNPPIDFGRALNRSFNERNVAYNVYFVYHTADQETSRKRFIFNGEPSDHAISASRTVTLVDGDRLVDKDGSLNKTTVKESSSYFAPDVGTDPDITTGNNGGSYNTVRVEVVAWRI